MKNQHRIAVIGVGALGTSLAWLLAHNKHRLDIYDFLPENAQKFKNHPQIKKQKNITIHQDLTKCIKDASIVLPCLPSAVIDMFYEKSYEQLLGKKKIISITKGFWPKTILTISQKLNQKLNSNQIMILSGPTFAHEILRQYPTSAIIGTTYQPNLKIAKELFNNDFFTISPCSKPVAVELGGILKNCYAITFGLIQHLNYGMNTKALCLHKVLQETKNLFQSLKLPIKSIYSPSFLGDLIATGFNTESRNFQFGFSLKKNKKNTIEGADNIPLVLQLASRHLTSLPILKTTKQIINLEKKPEAILEML